MTHSTVAFGTFELDLSTGELRSKGTRVALQDQPAQLLCLLVRQAGRVVPREELRKALWSDDTFVEFDTALNVAVNKVRQALRDSASSPRFVETVPRRGYRFLADVRPVEAEVRPVEADVRPAPAAGAPRKNRAWIVAGAAAAIAAAAAFLLPSPLPWRTPGAPRSVAVLPFRPLVADARDEALEVGMAEAVIVKLGRQQGLRVPSIGAVQRYAGRERDPLRAGRELGVDSVLDGSLQRSDGRLRVSARLLDVHSGTPRWAHRWDLPWTDVFTVQDAMAAEVARELALTLAAPPGPQHTTDPDVYERYLRARYLVARRTPEASRRAGELLEEVVRLDPGFAPAYAVMADAYLAIPWLGAPLEPHRSMARKAARRAVELDPTSAEAHALLGTVLAQFDWELPAGQRELERALELGPDVPTVLRLYSLFLWFEGRFDEALALNDRELALDPTSVFANRNRAIIYYYARRYEDCIAQSRKTLELDLHFITAYGWLGRSLERLGRDAEALDAFVQPLTFREDRADDVASLRAAAAAGGARGFWRRWLEIEERQPEYSNTDWPAMAWLRIGERERALAELERLCEVRSPWIRALGVEPHWDPIRADPRFQAMLRQARSGGR
jgi:TolB-like protein/DNA-binding winged helix-turn-helix (wHTH) protein/tetratricopeptide (TPR) repeat protein